LVLIFIHLFFMYRVVYTGMMGLDTTASSPPQRSVFEPVHSPQLNSILLGNNFHPFMLGTPGRVDDTDAEKRKGHPPLPTAPAAARKDDDMGVYFEFSLFVLVNVFGFHLLCVCCAGRARSRRAPSHRMADFVDTNHPSVSAALDEDPQQLVRRAASASVPDKSSSTPAAQPPTGAQTASEDKHRGCNCKKSQCLKLVRFLFLLLVQTIPMLVISRVLLLKINSTASVSRAGRTAPPSATAPAVTTACCTRKLARRPSNKLWHAMLRHFRYFVHSSFFVNDNMDF
jgi:hypothetical protein